MERLIAAAAGASPTADALRLACMIELIYAAGLRISELCGLPLAAVFALALLAVPRVVLHDLDILHEGTPINAVFVFAPPIVWIVAVLVAGGRRAFATVFAIGLTSGVLLAVVAGTASVFVG